MKTQALACCRHFTAHWPSGHRQSSSKCMCIHTSAVGAPYSTRFCPRSQAKKALPSEFCTSFFSRINQEILSADLSKCSSLGKQQSRVGKNSAAIMGPQSEAAFLVRLSKHRPVSSSAKLDRWVNTTGLVSCYLTARVLEFGYGKTAKSGCCRKEMTGLDGE